MASPQHRPPVPLNTCSHCGRSSPLLSRAQVQAGSWLLSSTSSIPCKVQACALAPHCSRSRGGPNPPLHTHQRPAGRGTSSHFARQQGGPWHHGQPGAPQDRWASQDWTSSWSRTTQKSALQGSHRAIDTSPQILHSWSPTPLSAPSHRNNCLPPWSAGKVRSPPGHGVDVLDHPVAVCVGRGERPRARLHGEAGAQHPLLVLQLQQ